MSANKKNHNNRNSSSSSTGSTKNGSGNVDKSNISNQIPEDGATPTLKVMRLQSPSLGQVSAGTLGGSSVLNSTLRLPDSFGVIHIGETFTAYLGALNASTNSHVLNLSVKAVLQTPSTRYRLPSSLEVKQTTSDKTSAGFSIPPTKYLSTIVSRTLEEVGPHVLRVEVRYSQDKSIRKYYRFNVSSPLSIRELTVRGGDSRCFVSIAIENVTANSSIIIDSADFEPAPGLSVTRVGNDATLSKTTSSTSVSKSPSHQSAVQIYDSSGHFHPGAMFRYLFLVQAVSQNATIRGIARGDELGKAIFSWKKTMGDEGRIASMSVICPPSLSNSSLFDRKNNLTNSKFVIHGSGLSIDVAADSTNQTNTNNSSSYANVAAPNPPSASAVILGEPAPPSLSRLLPVTVEPIHNPPTQMFLAKPESVQLLIINHSPKPLNLQLQFRLHLMSGAVICGESFRNLGILKEKGGSTVVEIRIVALVAGLFRCQGCWIVDLETGSEMMMPSLFNVFVHKKLNNALEDDANTTEFNDMDPHLIETHAFKDDTSNVISNKHLDQISVI